MRFVHLIAQKTEQYFAHPTRIPARPEEVTASWLTDALRAGGSLRRGRCTGVRVEIVGQDWGFTGVIARLFLAYDQAGLDEAAPATLIAKLPLAERSATSGFQVRQRQAPDGDNLAFSRARREITFYRQIAPLTPLRVPRLFAAVDAEASGIVLLVLEDVAPAEPGDALAGAGVQDVRQVMRAMARFHARWWTGRADPVTSWLPPAMTDPPARQERFARAADRLLARDPILAASATGELIQRLRSRYANVLNRLARAPQTVVHADLHLDNVLFVRELGEEPRVVVIDWQSVARGPALIDIAPFVVTSLTIPDRRAYEESLLGEYLAALGAAGVRDFNREDLVADHRAALLVRLASVVGWVANSDIDRLNGREQALTEAALGDGRLVAALADHDLTSFLDNLQAD